MATEELLPVEAQASLAPRRGRASTMETIRRLLRVRLAGAGFAVVALAVIAAVFAPWLAPYDPMAADSTSPLRGPSLDHLLGTDLIGRDTLSRLLYGSRASLEVGVVAVAIAIAVGVPLGLLSGYRGGVTDMSIMRIMDALYAFPGILLALGIVAVLGPGMVNVMIAIGIGVIPIFARLVRSEVLSIRERDYISAAKALGANEFRVLALHVWPNATAAVIVQGSMTMAYAILAEAGLSFLGVGVKPPTPTWGIMLQQGYSYLEQAPWLSVFPGLAILLLVLGLNFVGDALRDVLDPRLNYLFGARPQV